MYTVIVDCTNFVLEHGMHVLDADNNTISLMHLPTTEIVRYIAEEPKITKVKLTGITEFCNGIKEDIENSLKLEYSNNERQIEIEVL